MNLNITDIAANDPALQRLQSIVDNADKHVANIIPYEDPKQAKPQPEYMQRDKMGRIITPAELVLFGHGMPDDEYASMLAAASIDVRLTYDKPPTLFTFDGYPLLTMQNISVISGKAKSRKSGWASVLAAMVINPNSNQKDWQKTAKPRLESNRPWQRNGVLLFDTEQAAYDAWKGAKRILHMAGRTDAEGQALRMFSLRDFTPGDRLRFIADTIQKHADTCSLIIIDGVRDVVMNINSEDEATLMATWLLNVTKRHNVHIACVLHENKSTDTLRGHLGTELQNKAEAVFTVTKGSAKHDRDLSSVETPFSRNKGMEKIGLESIEVDQDGHRFWIPAIIDDNRVDAIGKESAARDEDNGRMDSDRMGSIVAKVFSQDGAAEISADELISRIQAVISEDAGKYIGQSKAKTIKSKMEMAGLVIHNGKPTKGRLFKMALQPSVNQPITFQPRIDFNADDVPF